MTIHRFVGHFMRHALGARLWFRCAMAALALGYAFELVAHNGPYWEPDVAYLHWSTDVPAITVCPATTASQSPSTPSQSQQSAPQSMSEYFEVDNTFRANVIKWTEEFKKKDITTICMGIFKSCSWNGKVFNCCRHFQPHLFVIESPCFSINSQQTVNKRKKLVVSHFTKKGELKMEFTKPVEISMHGTAELWFGEIRHLLKYVNVDAALVTNVVVANARTMDLLYAPRQIIEHDSLASLDFSTRGCVLRGEKKLQRHLVYGQSACLLECALQQPYAFAKNRSLCDCPPTCAAIEINTVWNGTQRSFDNVTRCVLAMSKPATERLVMKARKDYVDLTVIFACLLQLFTGFNLLEIPKFILGRKKACVSVRR